MNNSVSKVIPIDLNICRVSFNIKFHPYVNSIHLRRFYKHRVTNIGLEGCELHKKTDRIKIVPKIAVLKVILSTQKHSPGTSKRKV